MKGSSGDGRGAKWSAFRNWLDYHIGWVILGAVLVWLLSSVIMDDVTRPKTDVQAAYVGSETLTDSASAAIQTVLESYCPDVNGDGKVVVEVVSYVVPTLFEPSMQGLTEYLTKASLAGDLEAEQSELFLLEDASVFQRTYLRLELPGGEGALPDADDFSGANNSLRWSACPALANAALDGGDSGLMVFDADREFIQTLEICPRGYATAEDRERHWGASALWDAITEGAG